MWAHCSRWLWLGNKQSDLSCMNCTKYIYERRRRKPKCRQRSSQSCFKYSQLEELKNNSPFDNLGYQYLKGGSIFSILWLSVRKMGLFCSVGEMHKNYLHLFVCYARFETQYLNKSLWWVYEILQDPSSRQTLFFHLCFRCLEQVPLSSIRAGVMGT